MPIEKKREQQASPYGITAEEIKKRDIETLANKLSDMIKRQYFNPWKYRTILKPGKNQLKPESYREVIILSLRSQLISKISL